jgi:hypothetical protein
MVYQATQLKNVATGRGHQAEQDHAQGAEVDADAGDVRWSAGDQVGERAVGWFRPATAWACVVPAGVLAELLADQAVHQLVDGVAQDLRAEDLAGVLRSATATTGRSRSLGSQLAEQPPERAPEVLGFSTGMAMPPIGPMPPPGPRPRTARAPPIGPPGGAAAPPCSVVAASRGRSCHFLPGQLRVHDLLIGLAGLHQLRREFRCRPSAAVEDDDLVGVHDRPDALGDDDHGRVRGLLGAPRGAAGLS